MKIVKRFTFASAHYLPDYNGKCKQLHGHTYVLEVSIIGEVNPDTGMVMDFHQLDYTVKSKVLEYLDHKCLNDVIKNPTAENVALWIMNELCKHVKEKISIKLWETETSHVEL